MPDQSSIDPLEAIENAIYTVLERYSNVHRGSGQHSLISTELFEESRRIVMDYFDIPIKNRTKYTVIFGSAHNITMIRERLRSGGPSHLIDSARLGLHFDISALMVESSSLPRGSPPMPGGGTVVMVLANKIFWQAAPEKYEPGTPNIIGAIALAKALSLIKKSGNPSLFKDIKHNASFNEVFDEPALEYSGKKLLEVLRNQVIGRKTVPTLNGENYYINFDNAASTQTFHPVWTTVQRVLRLPEENLTDVIPEAREIVGRFFNAPLNQYDIIFVMNTTEGINIVAENLRSKDFNNAKPVIVTTLLEHNSNELPWRFIPGGRSLRVDVDESGFIDMNHLERLLQEYNSDRKHGEERIVLTAFSGASNVLGTVNDIKAITELAHRYGSRVLVDAAQLAAHRKIDTNNLGIDYLVFSGHKIYAPFGSGGLIARKGLLTEESDQQNIIGIAALGKALLLLGKIGMDTIAEEETSLTSYALHELKKIAGVKVYGLADVKDIQNKIGVISFKQKGMHHSKTAELLAEHHGIGVRSGCFCAHLLMRKLLGKDSIAHIFKRWKERYLLIDNKILQILSIVLLWTAFIPAMLCACFYFLPLLALFPSIAFWIPLKKKFDGLVRISFGLYNTKEEVDVFIESLKQINKKFPRRERITYQNRMTHLINDVKQAVGKAREQTTC